MRRLTALLLILGILLAAGAAWARPPAGVTYDIQIGYNGWIQYGRVNPVVVEMENQSADTNLSGELVLDCEGTEYVAPLELPTPARKRFFLYFPCGDYPPILTVRFRTRSWTEEQVIDTYKNTIDAANANILVISQQSGELGVLNKLPSVRLHRDLHAGFEAEIGTSESFVAYYDLDEIDTNPKFFSRADTIIISDIDFQQVTTELVETLKACVSGGTNLIFSLGLNGAGVAASPLAEICPLAPQDTVLVDDLGAFGRRYGIATGDHQTLLATGRIATGAEVTEWGGQYPAVVRMLRGSGRVTALAFDYTAPPFKQNPALVPMFVDSALRVEDSVQVNDWFIHPQNVSDVLERLSEAKPIPPQFVLLFLVFYIVLIGPANFLILGRLKRRTLVWTTIPLIIIGFAYLGLSTGYIYRGSDNVCAYFQELHVFPGADYLPYQTTMLVFTAERTNYELEIPDRSAFMYPDIPNVVDQYTFGGGGRFRGLSGSKIENSQKPKITTTQGKWTQKTYFYQGYLNMAAGATSHLDGEYSDLQPSIIGDFTLNLPFDLYNCQVFMPGGGAYDLGNLAGQGTYSVIGNQTNIAGRLDSENYLVVQSSMLRSQMAQTVRNGHEYRDELLLVGFTEEVQALAEFKRPHQQHSLTMVVVHLPFDATISRQGNPRVIRTRLVGGSGFAVWQGRFDRSGATGQTYLLTPGAELDIGYDVMGNLDADSFLHLSLVGQLTRGDVRVTDFNGLIEVEVWDDDRWRPVRVPLNETAIDIRVGQALDTDRRVIVRVRAVDEVVFGVPLASVF
ncbi:hypothetical protein JW859_01480 [bacterium]|nr:hypothetical protein [bacterium]